MAISSYCLGHSTSISARLIDNITRGMRDCIGVCMEIAKLIKFSPKRENMLEDIKMREMIMAKSHEDLNKDYDEAPLKIKKFCSARWTMRHLGFIRIRDNYKALLTLWRDI